MGLVWVLPRGTSTGILNIPRRNILEKGSRRAKQTDGNITLNRYAVDERGAVSTWGIKLRKNEADAIVNFYKTESATDRLETTLKILLLGFENQLNKSVKIDQYDLGSIIEEKKGLVEPISEFVVEG